MPKINLSTAPLKTGTGYPAPYDKPCLTRHTTYIGDAGGLTQFGANMITLPPGVWASQRHWHSHEDELVYIVSGTPTFIDDDGEQLLAPGDFTAHPAGDGNGHHMINKTDKDVVFLVIGTRNPAEDNCYYPEVDLRVSPNGTSTRNFTKKDGSAF